MKAMRYFTFETINRGEPDKLALKKDLDCFQGEINEIMGYLSVQDS